MKNLGRDLRYGMRMLGRTPGFTSVAIGTLALGIGACAVVFSLVQAMVAPPLAARRPETMVVVSARDLRTGMDYASASMEELRAWQAQSRVVARFAAVQWTGSLGLAEGETAEAVRGAYVSPSLFAVFEAAPALGRAFGADEEQPQNATVAMLGHDLWVRRFGGAREAIGRTVRLDGRPYAIVGVLPPEFVLAGAEVFLPLAARPATARADETERNLLVFGQLRAGASPAQARADLATIATAPNREVGVEVRSMREWASGEYRQPATLLFAAVGFVLLIACANVAGLLLARGIDRRREYAVRLALGATRGQIVQQLLIESALLAAAGGVLGFLLSLWAIDGLNAANPFAWRFALRANGAAIGFTAAVSMLAVLLSGLAPALLAARPDVHGFLKEGAAPGRESLRLRNGMIAAQIALSFLLLAGAGLLLRSVWSFSRLPLGFEPRGVATMWLNLAGHRYARTEAAMQFGERLLERFRQTPAVRHAAAAHWIDLPATENETGFTIGGGSLTIGSDAPATLCTAVTSDYFHALGATLLRGRAFDERDRAGGEGVAIVNERLARAIAPNGAVIGRQMKLGGRDAARPWLTIVGVIADVRHPSRLELSEIPFDIYIPFAQQATALTWPANEAAPRLRSLGLLVRADDPEALRGALQREVWAVDREQPIQQIRLLTEGVRLEAFEKRAMAWLLGAFALAALGLSALGLYGLLAYVVRERRREIGIRLALGAEGRDVVRLIVRQGMALVLLGAAIGLLGALALARLLEGLLFGVRATDPLTWLAAALALGLTALAACWLPARGAARVDPLLALRAE